MGLEEQEDQFSSSLPPPLLPSLTFLDRYAEELDPQEEENGSEESEERIW